MKLFSIFVLLFILSVSVACSKQNGPKYDQPITSAKAILKTTLASLNLKNPENDFNTNANNKDYRFMGVCGYACYAAGVQSKDTDLIEKYGLRILRGTSDAVEGDEHMQLILQATKYAQTYNEYLLIKIRNNEIP